MIRVAILAYRGCWATGVHIAADFFRIVTLLEQNKGHPRLFNAAIVSDSQRSVQSASLALITPESAETGEEFDIVIIPPIEGSFLLHKPQEVAKTTAFLAKYWNKRSTFVCFSTAASFSAKSGLLPPGQYCSTHWAYIDSLKKWFPNLCFSAEKPFSKIGNVYATSTFTGGLDVLLEILKQNKGDSFAQLCSTYALLSKPQDSSPILPEFRNHDDLSIHKVQQWICDNRSNRLTICLLAKQFNLSERSLKRRFTEAAGIPVNRYIQLVRLDLVKKLLLASRKTVKEISLEVGYENDGFLAKIFKRETGCSPAQWRAEILSTNKKNDPLAN